MALRSTALGLFGACSLFCQGSLHDHYMEQAHNNLISLLIHLNDPEPSVVLVRQGEKGGKRWGGYYAEPEPSVLLVRGEWRE